MAAETWDQRYRRGEHAEEPPFPFIARFLNGLEGDGRRALDLACGAGRHSLLLASRGWSVTAVDWSAVALESIADRNPAIQTVQADLEAGEYVIEPSRWDLICISYFLARPLFPLIRAGVKPGRWLLAAFPVADPRPGVRPMNPAYVLEPGELARIFQEFELVHSREVEDTASTRRRAELIALRELC